jgi:hypothetical protein
VGIVASLTGLMPAREAMPLVRRSHAHMAQPETSECAS